MKGQRKMNQVFLFLTRKNNFFSQTQLARSVVLGVIFLFSFSLIVSIKTVMTSTVILYNCCLNMYLHRLMGTLEWVLNSSGAQSCYSSSPALSPYICHKPVLETYGTVVFSRPCSSIQTIASALLFMTKEPLW